jgi:hypothetical protein
MALGGLSGLPLIDEGDLECDARVFASIIHVLLSMLLS